MELVDHIYAEPDYPTMTCDAATLGPQQTTLDNDYDQIARSEAQSELSTPGERSTPGELSTPGDNNSLCFDQLNSADIYEGPSVASSLETTSHLSDSACLSGKSAIERYADMETLQTTSENRKEYENIDDENYNSDASGSYIDFDN